MPERIQLSRRRGWRMPENTRKVDRSTIYGNPFRPILISPEEAVACFRSWLVEGGGRLGNEERREKLLAGLPALRGKNLACWCKLPEPGQPDICHAAVLLELAASEFPTPKAGPG